MEWKDKNLSTRTRYLAKGTNEERRYMVELGKARKTLLPLEESTFDPGTRCYKYNSDHTDVAQIPKPGHSMIRNK